MLRALFSIALLAAAFSLTPGSLDWAELFALGPGKLALCLLLSGLMILLLAWRWRFVVSKQRGGRQAVPGIGSFLRLTWLALATNQVLPSVVAGDALRVSLLARRGIPAIKAAGSVVVDRFYGLAALAFMCLPAAWLMGADLLRPSIVVIACLVATAAMAVAVSFAVPRAIDLLKRIRLAAGSMTSLRDSLVIVPAAVAGHLANIAIFLIIADALGVGLPVLPATAVMAAVLLAGVLPFSVAGWGIREFSLVHAFGGMGIDQEKVVLASVAYGLVLLFTQALGFSLLIWRARP